VKGGRCFYEREIEPCTEKTEEALIEREVKMKRREKTAWGRSWERGKARNNNNFFLKKKKKKRRRRSYHIEMKVEKNIREFYIFFSLDNHVTVFRKWC
jgi:hypothetical protein